MGTAKVEVGEVTGSWGLLEMSEEEVAFYQRFVARHGGSLVAMGEPKESYRLDFPPGTLRKSGGAEGRLRTVQERGQGVGDASCLPGREVVWCVGCHEKRGSTHAAALESQLGGGRETAGSGV